jgi:hypothetical protein
MRKKISGLTAFSSILLLFFYGERIGKNVAHYVPDSFISDDLLVKGIVTFLGLSVFLIILILKKYFISKNPDPIGELRQNLIKANNLLKEGLITQDEMLKIRETCLEKNKNDINSSEEANKSITLKMKPDRKR